MNATRSTTASKIASPANAGISPRVIPWFLIVITLLAYGGTLGHEFVGYDDSINLYLNGRLNPPTLGSVLQYWKEIKEGAFGLYIPLTYTIWGILAKATYVPTADEMNNHLDPHVFHAAGLLFHVLAVCAVYQLLKRLVQRPWAAAAGAALFALHPFQVESVCWAAGLKDVMYGLLSLTALNQYLAAVWPRTGSEWNPASQPVSRGRYVLAMLAFIGAMLSKPTAVVTPALALVLDRWVVKRPWRRVVIWLAPWFLLAVPFVIIGRITQYTDNVHGTTPLNRPFVAGDALSFYLGKLLFPFRMGIDYGLMPAYLTHHRWTYMLWVLPAGSAILAWRSHWRSPLLWVAFALFAIPLLPNSGITPFQFQYYSVVADHYMYLAMLGPAVALAWLVARWPRKAVAVGCSLWLAFLLARTVDQARSWQNNLDLNMHTLEVNDHSFLGHNNLGFAYDEQAKARLIAQDIPGAKEAARLARFHYEASTRFNPDDTHGWSNLASLDMRLLNVDAAIAEGRQLVRANRALPPQARQTYLGTFLSVASLAADTGHYADAFFFLHEILSLKPDSSEAAEELRHLNATLATRPSRDATTPR